MAKIYLPLCVKATRVSLFFLSVGNCALTIKVIGRWFLIEEKSFSFYFYFFFLGICISFYFYSFVFVLFFFTYYLQFNSDKHFEINVTRESK